MIEVYPAGAARDYGNNTAPAATVAAATIFAATADKTIANTAVETTLFGTGVGSLTIPANRFVPGTMIRMVVHGYVAGTASPGLRIKGFVGATNVVDTGLLSSSIAANHSIRIECVMTCRSVGVSGAFIGQVLAVDGPAQLLTGSVTSATQAVDTTAAQTLDFTWKWTTASASNTITITNATVELLN